MNEEANTNANELKTVDGTFIDNVVDTLEIPEMSYEEADTYKESEKVTIEEEGGK